MQRGSVGGSNRLVFVLVDMVVARPVGDQAAGGRIEAGVLVPHAHRHDVTIRVLGDPPSGTAREGPDAVRVVDRLDARRRRPHGVGDPVARDDANGSCMSTGSDACSVPPGSAHDQHRPQTVGHRPSGVIAEHSAPSLDRVHVFSCTLQMAPPVMARHTSVTPGVRQGGCRMASSAHGLGCLRCRCHGGSDDAADCAGPPANTRLERGAVDRPDGARRASLAARIQRHSS